MPETSDVEAALELSLKKATQIMREVVGGTSPHSLLRVEAWIIIERDEEQAREIERLREQLRLANIDTLTAEVEVDLRDDQAGEIERLRGLLREVLPWLRDAWAICPPGTPEYLALGKLVEATIEAALQEGPANDDGAG